MRGWCFQSAWQRWSSSISKNMRAPTRNTYNALDLITDTITVVLLMAWIAIMMMTIIMMKDWMAKCDISGQLGSAPPGRACNQMQIVQHSSMRCHHHHHHHHYHQNHKCNWQLISKVSIPAFQRPTLAVDPLLSLRLWWSDSFRRIGGKYEGNASSKDVGI